MTSPSIGKARANSVNSRNEDWSEVEALLEAPARDSAPRAAQKRKPARLALGLIALAALGGGSVVLKAAIMPGCRGDACETRLAAPASAQPSIRDVTVTPLVAAADPLPRPIQQGRSIAAPPPAQGPRALPRMRSHAVHVAAKPVRVARNTVPVPVRRPVAVPLKLAATARPTMARHPMRAMVARPVRLQQVFLSPNRYILVERR